MIKNTLVFFLFILLVYTLIIKLLPDDLDTGQHQWNENLIKAQNYLYNEANINEKTIIIGSSLSVRLIMDSLSNHFINMALGGLGVFDGLSIINHRKEKPKRILIEMNKILREEDEEFSKTIFSPPGYYLKKYIPALQEKNQPVGVVKGLLFNLLEKKTNKPNKIEIQPKINEKILSRAISTHSKAPLKSKLRNVFGKLKEQIDILRQNGVSIVFFELPIESVLHNLEEPTIIRQSFLKEFPKSDYEYIEQPNCKDFYTTDGVHLSEKSAVNYTIYLRRYLENKL